jgi:nucleotide sugar dehydrogenase
MDRQKTIKSSDDSPVRTGSRHIDHTFERYYMTSTFEQANTALQPVGVVEPSVSPSSLNVVAEPRSVGVVGLGYVGLPTALALAESGIAVLGCDISEARLAAIKAQRVDLLDAHLALLDRFLETELLTLTTETSGLSAVDTVLVCVPTPVDTHLVPDLTALWAACAAVVEAARPGQTIVLTSTTYVGCTQELLVEPLRQRGLIAGRDLFVAFSPERIDPGSPSHVPERTPRVVGGVTELCTAHAVQTLAKSAAAVHTVSCPEAAELTKLLENTFRAVNIALANEFAAIARQFDIDVTEVICAAATKPYGFMAFHPGPGVGGHCIPCDPHYLLWQLKASKLPSPVTEAAMAAIAARPHAVVSRAQEVLAEAGRALAGARILIVGVAYKPAVADIRESPALQIIDELVRRGAEVAFTDVMVESVRTASGTLLREPDPACADWDLVVVHTVHPGQDYGWLSSQPAVLDTTYRLAELAERHVL